MSIARLARIARQRLRAVLRKDSLDEELSRELALHYEYLVQEFLDEGLPLDQAQVSARKAIGNMPLLEEQCRDHRAVTWFHDLCQDVIYGVRMLRKNPGFTCVAVLSLALGIGANTAILSVTDAVFRGSSTPLSDQLMVVRTFPFDSPRQETHALLADYFDWRDESQSFDLMGAALGHQADFSAETDSAPAQRIPGQAVTAEGLRALGVPPQLGRLFTDGESQVDAAARVIIISHRLWQGRFGSRPDILGQQVRLDRADWTVIGVMPEAFRFPNEIADYWVPLRPDRNHVMAPSRFFIVLARLKAGVTREQAQSEMDLVAARLAQRDPDRRAGWGVRVKPLRDAMFGWTAAPLFTLGAAVALVLLVACANLAGLLLARGLTRMPEVALRRALGAGSGRIVRQLLTESLVLSLAGGALGVFVAWGGVQALSALTPPPGSVAITDVGVNLRTLGLTALISIATGLLFGLAPALLSVRSGLTEALKESPNSARSEAPPRFRSVIVAAQVAVTVVLLVGSGLLMKSFLRVSSRDLQFDPDRLLTFEVHIPAADYLRRRGSLDGLPYFEISPPPSLMLERVYRGLRGMPGVNSVAGISFPLMNSVVVPSTTINLEQTSDVAVSAPRPSLAIGVGGEATHLVDRRSQSVAYLLVTPDFFTSIKAQIIDGRDFSDRDTATSQWVAIVNESAARRFWPGENAVGQRFRMTSVPDERPREVIAVIRDIPLTRQGDLTPVVYASYLQQPSHYPQPGSNMFGQMMFLVRSDGDPMSLVPGARRVVAEIDPDRPLSAVTTMRGRLGAAVPQRGYVVLTLSVFALTAMGLAAIGIYGVMAYTVAQRTREIGIRVAMGAKTREVMLLVGRRALLLVAIGLSIGLASSLGLTRLLQSQLWGVTPTDPATFASVVIVFALVALAAAFFPLRRATGVDPTIALRSE